MRKSGMSDLLRGYYEEVTNLQGNYVFLWPLLLELSGFDFLQWLCCILRYIITCYTTNLQQIGPLAEIMGQFDCF